jgi:hypothetical protein
MVSVVKTALDETSADRASSSGRQHLTFLVCVGYFLDEDC